MKLSTLTAKLTCMKSKTAKVLAAATLAGAFLTAAAPVAQAQRIGIGIGFGGPRYYAPPPPVVVYRAPYGNTYGYRGYDDHRFYGWHARDEFYRHQQWEREHDRRWYGR